MSMGSELSNHFSMVLTAGESVGGRGVGSREGSIDAPLHVFSYRNFIAVIRR